MILECCQIDDENPFLKEVSVFAIRNLCAGHSANQALIDELQPIQVVENSLMDELQIKGCIENGKVKIQSHMSP